MQFSKPKPRSTFLAFFIDQPLKAQCCSLRSTSAVTVATAAISRQILSGTSQTSTKRSAEHDPDHLMVQIDFKIDQYSFQCRTPCPICGKKYSDLRQHIRLVHEGHKVNTKPSFFCATSIFCSSWSAPSVEKSTQTSVNISTRCIAR